MSVQDKFNAGDKVKWNDAGYWQAFFEDEVDFEDVLIVLGYNKYHPSLVELQSDRGVVLLAFDWRLDLVESFQGLNGTPSNQGKTCSQNCVSCKDKETPVLEDKDENEWFKRGELPPVGANIEYKLGGGPWYEATVKYVLDVLDGDEDEIVIACPHLGFEQLLMLNKHTKIRPALSPEDIAKQERKKVIDAISDVLIETERMSRYTDVAAHLYDAGLRFVEDE